jgi:hypothetical protein
MPYLDILRPGSKKNWCPSSLRGLPTKNIEDKILMNLLDILKSMLFLCIKHATAHYTRLQQIWQLILSILIFWIADSNIAINTLIMYINKLNTLSLIFDTVIKNKKNNHFKIILKVH